MRRPPLHAWKLEQLPVRPLTGGLINHSFVVGDPPVAVIQRLHPVFGPTVNLDIEAVTEHLAAKGLVTPLLLRTALGEAWVEDEGIWRALSWVPGITHHKLRDTGLALEAGRLVAHWHRATRDLDHPFAFSRPLAHDIAHHMAVLEAALGEHPEHPLADEVEALGQSIAGAYEELGAWDREQVGVTHGDLKISNLRFDEQGRGVCLLDLDTMGRGPLSLELGDAWRSWCNPASEDATETRFDLTLFEASARGYLEVNAVDSVEALPAGVERICVELAARFAADALSESYFGWDPARFPSRGHHNLLRARGQFALSRSVHDQRDAMLAILTACS